MSNVVTYPHTEEPEMSKVKEIFDRALNALVSASSLAKEVEQVKSDLEALTSQVNHYRNTIANQDDQITRLRQDRDAARTAQYQAEDNQRHMTTQLETINRENDSLNGSNIRLNDRISEVTKERDDAQFQLLELQESHAALSKKLDAIKSHMESLFSVTTVSPPPATHWIGEPEPSASTPVALSSSEGPKPAPEEGVPNAPISDPWPVDPEPPVNPPEPTPSFPEDIKR
jgi:DNA repair exonuclease SbcCD ATPase subunit